MRGILWVIWIVLVALLGWGVFQYKAPAIQNDILNRTTQAVKETTPNVDITVDGRLVTLKGTASSQEEKDKTLAAASSVWGALGPNDELQVAANTPADQSSPSQSAVTPPPSAQSSSSGTVTTGQASTPDQGTDTQLAQQNSKQPASNTDTANKPEATDNGQATDQQNGVKPETTSPSSGSTEEPVPAKENTDSTCDQSIAQVMQGKDIRFDSSSSNITPASAELIADIVKAAKPCSSTGGLHINISGYADSSGNNVHNRKLSQRRAEAVKNALVSQGLPADWITTKGFGDAQPVSSNDTVEGRAQNRRVTLDLTIH